MLSRVPPQLIWQPYIWNAEHRKRRPYRTTWEYFSSISTTCFSQEGLPGPSALLVCLRLLDMHVFVLQQCPGWLLAGPSASWPDPSLARLGPWWFWVSDLIQKWAHLDFSTTLLLNHFLLLWNRPDSWILSWQTGLPGMGWASSKPIPTLLIDNVLWVFKPPFSCFCRCMLLGHHLRGLEYRMELMQLLALSGVSESDARDDKDVSWELLIFCSRIGFGQHKLQALTYE